MTKPPADPTPAHEHIVPTRFRIVTDLASLGRMKQVGSGAMGMGETATEALLIAGDQSNRLLEWQLLRSESGDLVCVLTRIGAVPVFVALRMSDFLGAFIETLYHDEGADPEEVALLRERLGTASMVNMAQLRQDN